MVWNLWGEEREGSRAGGMCGKRREREREGGDVWVYECRKWGKVFVGNGETMVIRKREE